MEGENGPRLRDSMRWGFVVVALVVALVLAVADRPTLRPPPHEPNWRVSGHTWERDWYRGVGVEK